MIPQGSGFINIIKEMSSSYLFFAPNVSLFHLIIGILIEKIGTFDAAFLMNNIFSFFIIAAMYFSVLKLTKSKLIAFISATIITLDPLFLYITEGIEYNLGSIFFMLLMIIFTMDYINSREKSTLKLIFAFFSLFLSQAGRPEFQFISPIIFILLFLTYDNKHKHSKKNKYIFLIGIFIASLYCINIINHFVSYGDIPVTKINTKGKTFITFIKNSFDIGKRNLFGDYNIFKRFRDDLSLRRMAFVMSLIALIVSFKKKKYISFCTFTTFSFLTFMYFYTFWMNDGPFSAVGKHSPMVMIWIYMLESLGIYYIYKFAKNKSKSKLNFKIIAIIIAVLWLYNLFVALTFMNPNKTYYIMQNKTDNIYFKHFNPLFTYGKNSFNFVIAETEIVKYVKNDVNNLSCPFILYEDSIVPGIYGSKDLYYIYFTPNKNNLNYSIEHVKNLINNHKCAYFVFDQYFNECGDINISSPCYTKKFEGYKKLADVFKNKCKFELISNHTIQNRPFLIYRVNERTCNFK